MSYLRKIEYTIIPEKAFEIIRNCPGCGGKAVFHNTNCFHVNANGNEKLFQKGDLLVISNNYSLKVRTDKIVAEVLDIKRPKMKELQKAGIVIVTEEKQQHKITIKLDGEIDDYKC